MIGIDPGYARIGYSIIQFKKNQFQIINCGLIETLPKNEPTERLSSIHRQLQDILGNFTVDTAAVEQIFYAKNHKTAMMVAQARGVILLSLALFHIPVFEYTPLQVKQAILGYGRADKLQIKKTLELIFNHKISKVTDDVTDSMAVAICHLNSLKMKNLIQKHIIAHD